MAQLKNPHCPKCDGVLILNVGRFWCTKCKREHRMPALERACKEAYENGRKAAKAEIRGVLGV